VADDESLTTPNSTRRYFLPIAVAFNDAPTGGLATRIDSQDAHRRNLTQA
jgi:hypothetical protein